MKKILFTLLFLVMILPSSYSNENIYCFEPGSTAYAGGTPYLSSVPKIYSQRLSGESKNQVNRCSNPRDINALEIPKEIYIKLNNINEGYFKKNENAANNFKTAFGNFDRQQYDKFLIEWRKVLEDAYAESRVQLDNERKKREDFLKVELKKKKELERVSSLEKDYGRSCNKYKNNTEQFLNCLLEQEAKVKEAEAKKLVLQQERQSKIAEAELVKKKVAEAKIQEEQLKISKLNPDDRRAYTCNEKFGFKKGSDKFKDCIFELYKAETELEKLELQKQVAKANADAARANAEAARAGAERQERLALAQTEAAKMQALAARQQAIAANTADSLALIESGLRMMSPQRPAVAPMRTCTYNRNFMNCF